MFPSVASAEAALNDLWTWQNFEIAELACRCGGRFCAGAYWHAPDFLDRLQDLRDACGRPLVITSAHRCPQWNACVGGAARSRHKTIAVDIVLRGHDREVLLIHAQEIGFSGFGLARSFLHLDTRRRSRVWYYPGSRKLWQM